MMNSSSRPDGLTEAMDLLVPRIQNLDIEKLVLSTPFINPLQQDFYFAYAEKRRHLLF